MSNSNNKRNVAGTPTSSGHFHPRLSIRAAVSTTITEDAINLIQQQQQQNQFLSPRPQSPEAQSQDLMENLTKFVGPDGLIMEPVNLNGYVELMQYEVSPSRQVLLLKIIVATLEKNPSISEKLIECEGLMIILGLWLSIDQDKLLESLLVGKILEILSKLTFTVDLLVKYKFGRVVKKITQQKGKLSKSASIIFDLASKLYEEWSNLANKSEIPSVPRRKSQENVPKFEESEKHQSETTNTSQPAKRTSITIENENEFIYKVDESKKARISSVPVKKRVRFPDSPEQLCKIVIFERAPEEFEYLSDGSVSRDNYLHADRGEALMAFDQLKDMDAYEDPAINFKPWRPLEKLEDIPEESPDGIESEEKIIQRQRERSVLSVTYYSESEIPSTPSEVDVDYLINDSEIVKTIPIRSSEKIIKQKVSIKQPSLIVPQMFTPEIFNNYSGIYNNNLLNPFVTTTTPSAPYLKPEQAFQPSYTLSQPFLDEPFGISSRRSSVSSTSSYSSKSSSKDKDDRGHYSSRGLCRHYRPGKPKSCWLGSDCKFIHQD